MNTPETHEQAPFAVEVAIVERKPYSAPVLGEHGSVAETTQYSEAITLY